MTISAYAINKEARRLARADGKKLSRMTMLERKEYVERAKAFLETAEKAAAEAAAKRLSPMEFESQAQLA